MAMAMAPPLGFEGSGEKMSEGGVEKQYQHQHQHHGPVPRWQPNSTPQRPLVQPAQREEEPGAREGDGGDDDDDVRAGFPRIYAALCPLRLLYIDSVSAGKMANGALDSQDCILLAAQEWEGRVDGFVRMEGGFEVVLCEFERRLDVVRIARATGGRWKWGWRPANAT